ncbi:DUF3971 domain-containing protein [Candidatus Omnitrophota bacterium]
MTNSFSSSRHKVLKVLLIALISIVVLFFTVDLSLTLVFNHYLKKAKVSLQDDVGLDLDYSLAIFDIFSGIHIKNLSLSKDKDKIFQVNSIGLKPDFLNTILKRKLFCKEALIEDPHVYKTDKLDKAFLTFLLASLKNSQEVFRSSLVRLYNFNFMDMINFDIGGYMALAQSKVFLSRGKIRILKAAFIDKTDFDQSNSLLDSPLDYAFEATYINGDFIINKLDLIGFSARLIMSGRINDYQDTFDLDIKGELKDFLLEDVKQLNNDYVYARGILSSNFYVKGPIESSDFRAEVIISNSNLKVLDLFKMNRIYSKLIWDNKGLRSKKISGLLEDSPVSLSIDIGKSDAGKSINFELSTQKIDLLKDLNIKFQGYLGKNSLGADIEIRFNHEYDQKTLAKNFNFKNLILTFDEFGFSCDSAQIQLNEEKLDIPEKKEEGVEQEVGQGNNIVLQDISGSMAFVKDSFEFYNVEASVFDGLLKADGSFKSKGNALYYDANIILSKLNSEKAFREVVSDDFKLSGVLSGSIILNSKLRESLTGDIQIIDGELEDNSVLIAISDFFGIPSLRSVAFSNLKMIFYKAWNKYDAKISLFSSDVSIYLDNKSFIGKTLDGYLLVKMDTALTDESPRFKKLFKYIGYKEPTVYFPFQLKGYVGKPRIEWLENEFKEKLQDFLPESNQKLFQDALNKMVEDFAE